VSELAQSFQWVVSTLQGDSAWVAASTGGVFQGRADIGTIAPYTLVTAQTPGMDVLTVNVKRLFTRITLQIKAIGPMGNYAALVTIADRIDALFGRVGPTALSQGGVLSCWREQAIAYEDPKTINGQAYSHLGGLYHIDLQGS